MELSLEHARAKRNLSVDRVADLMGLANKWVIYKWVESGRIPAILIRPFEAACGINLVTRHLAHTDGKLIIDIPTGRKADAKQINELQASLNDAVSHLLSFLEGKINEGETVQALIAAMEDLAFHKKGVEKAKQPEFDFTGGNQ